MEQDGYGYLTSSIDSPQQPPYVCPVSLSRVSGSLPARRLWKVSRQLSGNSGTARMRRML